VNSFVDLHRSDRLAISIAWPPIELARAAVRTIAIDELPRFDAPFHAGHENPPARIGDLAELQLIEAPDTTTQQTLLFGCDIQYLAG
jgi:hypothetical protein